MPIDAYGTSVAEDIIALEDQPHILVADDDPSLVHLLKENLELEGYVVTAAFDGQMALRMAHQQSYDLIILDVNMPMLSGLKVFDYLRTYAGTASVPVIFVTGELSKDVYPKISEAPRVAYVKKPLDLESFNSLVRQYIEKYPQP